MIFCVLFNVLEKSKNFSSLCFEKKENSIAVHNSSADHRDGLFHPLAKDEMEKQSCLSHFVVQKKMGNADPRCDEIDVAIVQMIAVGDQLFSVVDNPDFINLNRKGMKTQNFFGASCTGIEYNTYFPILLFALIASEFYSNRMFVLSQQTLRLSMTDE
uniref:Uncharacterized protein n=1 Tax=Romanomermis culicivorax TaxID=13658 RepID=A0A915ILX4_ROMCU